MSTSEETSNVGFIQRLHVLANEVGTMYALAKKAGVSQSGMRKYFHGSEPTRAVLVAIADATGASIEWLATGRGERHVRPNNPMASEFDTIATYGGSIYTGDLGHVAMAFKKDWLRSEIGVPPNELFVYSVVGDSMEPTLRHGDVALIDHRMTRPVADGLYLLQFADGIRAAKRLQILPGGVVRAWSDNSAFHPVEVDFNADAKCIGRIVWFGRRI